ncbi:hypothetical protein [Alcaligenes faecalis]|uniref:hypothetical protein n=1 Tax=Alcaligenes faecalis TaxID=511 RepID=UPI001292CD68|nr:hypothetical protein [Alcaligenes faecalis]MBX6963324.1 hypothetical protein [Providencia rettgeri]MBX7029974.1 hypothetical protein [Alcaligenes faecalis]
MTETKRLGLGYTARGDDLVRIEHAVQAALNRIDESDKEAILRAFAIKNKFLPHKTSKFPKYVNGENATKPLFGVVLAIF